MISNTSNRMEPFESLIYQPNLTALRVSLTEEKLKLKLKDGTCIYIYIYIYPYIYIHICIYMNPFYLSKMDSRA